jgi:hypothetical protein
MPPNALKIGLLALGLGIGLGLFSVVPIVGCLALPLSWVLYAALGVLAALQLPVPRQPGSGAGAGALAGALAGVGYGTVNVIAAPILFSLMGGAEAAVQGLPPQLLEFYRQAGLDPRQFLSPWVITASAGLCCLSNFVFAAILGAVSGAITAASAR